MKESRTDGGPTEYVRCAAADCRIQTAAFPTEKQAADTWNRRPVR